MAKNSLRIWELELWLSTKMGLAIRNSVTPGQNSGQGHTEVFQDRFHLEQSSQGSIKDVESLYYTTGAEAGFKKETHECCQHYFRICRCWRSACQCSDHTPHTATSRFAWPSSQKEASSEAAGTEELRFVEGNMDSNMYCDILKQKMMPSLQKLFSIITTTPKHSQDDNWLTAEGEGDGVAKYVSRPEPYWVHVGHPQAEGGEAPCRTSSSSVMSLFMEEGKRMTATTCAALVNSIPRRIKAVLDNNGAPTKYWHFGHSFDMFT